MMWPEQVYKKKVRKGDKKLLRVSYIHTLPHVLPHTHTHTHTYSLVLTLQVYDTPVPDSIKEPRIRGGTELTIGELLVWIGIALKVGCLGRSRVSHYWSDVNGFGDDTI